MTGARPGWMPRREMKVGRPHFFCRLKKLNEKGSCRMNRELVTGLAQLSAEKGLPKEVVSDIIARAIKRAYGDEEHIDVKVDVQTGAFKVYLLKTVVEKVEDPKIQVQLDIAKKIKPDAQLGDVIPFEESAAALGRIGAQNAKQV